MLKNFKLALCQFVGGMDKAQNILKAQQMIEAAVAQNAQVIILPECFNSPYSTKYFASYAESQSDPESVTINFLKEISAKHSIYLIGGSIPERDGDRIYNTCFCINKHGEIIARHRKVHLFDIDVPGKITFFESDVLSPGNSPTIFETEFCKIGVGICYDLRFGEYAWCLAKLEDVGMLAYPGNFNMTTGPLHWELLLRARAVDNQIFIAGCSQARDESAEYVSWGNSSVVNPYGEVTKLDHQEGLLVYDIDFEVMKRMRDSIWSRRHKRFEVYNSI